MTKYVGHLFCHPQTTKTKPKKKKNLFIMTLKGCERFLSR